MDAKILHTSNTVDGIKIAICASVWITVKTAYTATVSTIQKISLIVFSVIRQNCVMSASIAEIAINFAMPKIAPIAVILHSCTTANIVSIASVALV